MNRAPNSLFTASFRHFAVDDFLFMHPIVCLVAIEIYRFMYVDSAKMQHSQHHRLKSVCFVAEFLDDLVHG